MKAKILLSLSESDLNALRSGYNVDVYLGTDLLGMGILGYVYPNPSGELHIDDLTLSINYYAPDADDYAVERKRK